MRDVGSAGGFGAVIATVAEQAAVTADFKDVVKVVVLRQITVEGLDTLLKYHLFDRGIRVDIEFGGYGSMAQDVLAPDGPVSRLEPDIIVLALAMEDLDPDYGLPGWLCDNVHTELESLLELLLSRTRAVVAVHNFLPPLVPPDGLLLDPQGHDLVSQVRALNQRIVDVVRRRAPRLVLVDWERGVRELGAAAALDDRGRYLWRAPFRHAFLDGWARQLSRIAAAMRGRAKKVLALDCDNTLWGGVVGEDGLEGIVLDREQYPGRAYYDFHTTILHLAERGVLVTLCSKNEEADVFAVLDTHPACRLKRSHLAGFRVNWSDKATNLAALAEELNLGLDAFVFVDDNAMECELVRQMLPQVTVLQVPAKLHELPSLVLQSGWFDTLQTTDEDRARARLYQSESQRRSVRGSFVDLDAYLQSLQTVAVIHPARRAEVARIAQLTQKTNQFNLTTRRYAEGEVQALADDPDAAVYTLSARDRFGDLGLVGVLIARREGRVGRIDSLLLSCRALGRRLEQALVHHCLHELYERWSLDGFEADYVRTARNAQVADFWMSVGFSLSADSSEHRHFVRSCPPAAEPSPSFVTIDAG